MKKLIWLSLFAATTFTFACGDDDTDDNNNNDDPGDVTPDAPPSVDAPPEPDAPPDAPLEPFVVPPPFAVPVSGSGPDQLQTAIATPDNKFLIAGFVASTPTGPKSLYVAKTSETGPDATFGTGGVSIIPGVVFVGGNDEIDIALQSTGKIIVTGTIADELVATDRDIAVVRLNADGSIDNTFGTAGVIRLDWGTGLPNGNGGTTAPDTVRSVAVGNNDTIFVHGAKRAPGVTATDTDFAIAKFQANGAVAENFGTNGVFSFGFNYLDEAGVPAPVTARSIKVLADGSVIGSGYTATASGTGMPVAPILYKITANGQLDPAFADGGLFYETVLARQTEVYNFAVHGDNIVTAGYGRESGDNNKWISLRFNANTGVRDTTWGGAPNGAVVFDPSGGDVTNNARNAIALPDGKTLIIGSSGTGAPAQNAAFAILDANGVLDTTYGTGAHTLPLGADGADQFWGVAVSATHIMIVGYSGQPTQTENLNDNSFGLVFPIR